MARLGRFSVATEYLYVATEQFYVAIELTRVRRISVATEDFYVAIELVTTESFTAHDLVGRVKASAHDSVASCCVATEETIRSKKRKAVYVTAQKYPRIFIINLLYILGMN